MMHYDEESATPRSPVHIAQSASRRLLRWQRRSRNHQILAVLGWLFILYIAFQGFHYITSRVPTSTGLLPCDSSRSQFSQTLILPDPPNAKQLSALWNTLQNSFELAKPQPLDLSLQTFESVSEYPTLKEIQTHTKLSRTDAAVSRSSHAKVVKEIPLYPKDLYKGRGIVILAGGRYSAFATTGMGMIREVGSTLPVEIWMKDRREEKQGWCKEIESEGMVCRRLSDYMDVTTLRHGYQLKINSILFSSFEQILFLDADNVPIRNPDHIFNSTAFTDTGVVLWPDYWKHSGAPLLPFEVGLTNDASELLRQDQTAETGQLVWDKKRHWKALCLATYYNYYGPQHYYTMISQGWAGWGDKDTFLIALRSLREDYYMVPHRLRTIFVNGSNHGIGMLQADPSSKEKYKPMFLHSNIIKWSVRDFLCTGCASDPFEPVPMSFLERSDSAINFHLKEHQRIFELEDMRGMDIDPEPLMWKSMEHTACKSVWKDDGLCSRTRTHMAATFGHRFKRPRLAAGALGYGDRACVTG